MSREDCQVFGFGNQDCRSRAPMLRSPVFILLLAALPVLLASCNYLGVLFVPPVYYTIGGSVSGLAGTGLVLLDNNGNNLTVSANATSFKFTVGIASGGNYDVIVFSQPSGPSQTCGVTNGSGPVTNANITTVQVTCTTDSFTIGGMISGLTGAGLVLQDNGGNNLSVGAGATSFAFPAAILSGGSYNVTVLSQPSGPSQTCVVANGSGLVTNANVTSVQVTCTTDSFTIGGTTSGLTGTGLVLLDNGGNNLTISAGATSFTFTAPIASGASYNVTVFSQPSNPSQTCGITNGSGPVTNANITSVQVACTASTGSLSISPPSVLVPFGWTQQFAATISGGGPVVSTWSVDGIVGGSALYGTINAAGLYTAPDTAPMPATVMIGAVDQANTSLTGTASLQIVGLFAYVTNQGTNGATGGSVNAYSINAAGRLIPIASPPSGPKPFYATADAQGRYLYVSDLITNAIYAYAIDPRTGGLTPTGLPTDLFCTPVGLAVHPSGTWLYTPCPDGAPGVYGFQISPVTGALTPLPGSPYPTGGLRPVTITMDSSGQFAFVSNNQSGNISIFSANPLSGQLTAVGTPVPAGPAPDWTITDRSGKYLYVMDDLKSEIYAYSIGSGGALTHFSPPFFQGVSSPEISAVSSNGKFLYVPNWSSGGTVPLDTASVFSIDPATGFLTVAGGSPFPTGGEPISIATEPFGKFAYVATQGSALIYGYSLDSATGAMSPLSTATAGQVPTTVITVMTKP